MPKCKDGGGGDHKKRDVGVVCKALAGWGGAGRAQPGRSGWGLPVCELW